MSPDDTAPSLCAAPRAEVAAPELVLPADACDCHFHVFDAPSPQVMPRTYTAPPAPLAQLKRVHATLGIGRSVVVQPSVYGTDNRTTLSAIESTATVKAVVVVDNGVSIAELRALSEAGAVGCRVNQLFQSNAAAGDLTTFARTLAEVNWHLQMLTDVSAIDDLASLVRALPVPLVFDHLGHMPAKQGVDHPGFQQLLRVLGDGQVWVKLSGPYRVSDGTTPDCADVVPLVDALVRTNPDRLVWGSDWPHPHVPHAMPDDTQLVNLLSRWLPDVATRHRVLVDNPATLYGF
ncbi:MAG: amidohydrolase family protein [Pseudomonadota bacterium]